MALSTFAVFYYHHYPFSELSHHAEQTLYTLNFPFSSFPGPW